MNSRKYSQSIGTVFFLVVVLQLAFSARLAGQEVFIYRPYDRKEALTLTSRVTLRGEFSAQLQAPSNFPSYNDLSGPDDRWTIGFQDCLLVTPTTRILAQLVAHNRGADFTKFDWHFSLRQDITRYVVFIIGHDSNHDADHASYRGDKRFFINRNYIGVGVPFTGKGYLVEPFLRFFHHTNQRTRLDLSGDKLKQESGLRIGAQLSRVTTLSFEALIQSSAFFNLAGAWTADVILRFRLTAWLEATVGGAIWQDWETDSAGKKQTYTKLFWGIAVPF